MGVDIKKGTRVIPNHRMDSASAALFNRSGPDLMAVHEVASVNGGGAYARKLVMFECHPDKHPRAAWLTDLRKVG